MMHMFWKKFKPHKEVYSENEKFPPANCPPSEVSTVNSVRCNDRILKADFSFWLSPSFLMDSRVDFVLINSM